MLKRPLLVSMALAAGIALAGCTGGSPAPTPTTTAGSQTATRPTPTATPTTAAPSETPEPTPTQAAPEAWTGEKAYAACIAFHREKATADGYNPDAADWNPYSADVARKSGSDWLVDLIGTVTDRNGTTYEGVFSCIVSGTPSAPKVTESAGL